MCFSPVLRTEYKPLPGSQLVMAGVLELAFPALLYLKMLWGLCQPFLPSSTWVMGQLGNVLLFLGGLAGSVLVAVLLRHSAT